MQLLRDQVAECGIELEVIEGDFATVLLPIAASISARLSSVRLR